MHTQQLTESQKHEHEKDLFFLFVVITAGLAIVMAVIFGLFIGSDHTPTDWVFALLFGFTVWCLLVIMGGCARQAWHDMRRL